MEPQWVDPEPADGHPGPWVVVDESRDERTFWGPFATVAEAEAWHAQLLAEYAEDGEDQGSYIDWAPLFPPLDGDPKPAGWYCPGEEAEHWAEHVEEELPALPAGRFRVHCGECGRDSYTEENPL